MPNIKKNIKYSPLYCRNGTNNHVNADIENIIYGIIIEIYGQNGGQVPDSSNVSSPFVIVKTLFLISI